MDQFTYLFQDTLRNNLKIARENAGDGNLLQSMQDAHLWSWFQGLEYGLDTKLGEHGKQLSGGERQRMAIARALLRNSPIWILDEPTANLDTITEKAIVKTIRQATRSRTVLWITHRLVQMGYYDRVYVLENGRISERGRHHQLMRGGVSGHDTTAGEYAEGRDGDNIAGAVSWPDRRSTGFHIRCSSSGISPWTWSCCQQFCGIPRIRLG